MEFRVRSGSTEDLTSILTWTQDTFSWGDYVPDRLPRWLEKDDGKVLVCVDEADNVLALTHVMMLSAKEGWLEAARVHPDHRRLGLGKALNHAGVDWCRERGALVARLAIEADNKVAIRQVEGLGYRRTSSWLFARWAPEDVKAQHSRLDPASGQDVDAAWVFWSTSDMARAARGLFSESWRWRKGNPEDLAAAASSGTLFQSQAGWAVVSEVENEPAYLRADWATTTAKDCPSLIDGVIDLAAQRGAGLYMRLPNLPWVKECLKRAGANPSEILVFAKPV